MIIKGQLINERYEIIRNIGEGGMANVYLANDTILNREVAVKILRGDLANDDKFIRRFQREAISASSLNHTNIVEMYDVGESNDKHYIVMEYIKGQTLKSLIKRRGALTISEVIDIMLQLTSGIAHAHESYIIHRDIKPQNILILEDGTVKITDFGIATALGATELTQTNSVMGSVHYLPPEQANGADVTIKSDIYSLGILMYELITGKLPFKGENAVEIAIKQMRDSIPSVIDINESLPQSFENIILKACAKNPKNRYNSALEMHEDIKTCLDKERSREPKLIYQYSESETEKPKKVRRSDVNNKLREDNEDKKNNKKILIFSIIAAVLLLGVISFVFLLPMFSGPKEVIMPDLIEKSENSARNELEELGLEVKISEKASDTIEEGHVISTDPKAKSKIKEGNTVELVISTGLETFEVDSYVDKQFEIAKTLLEEKGIIVESEVEEVSSSENIAEGTILAQFKGSGTYHELEVGTELKAGDTVTFLIAQNYTEYPDFVNDNYTLDKVEAFAAEYKLTLDIVYEETEAFLPNYIISQSRTAGSKVVTGATLKVVVSKELEKAPAETGPSVDDTTVTDPTTDSNTDSGATE